MVGAGLTIAAATSAAFAQDSAQPVNPDGLGTVVSTVAQNTGGVGDTVSNLATNNFGPGAAAEIQLIQRVTGSNPTPPPNPDLDTPLPVEPH